MVPAGRMVIGGAHPRSRGENADVVNLYRIPTGSSPLTRGKPRKIGIWGSPTGLIPAHAGKTGTLRPRARMETAHPRSRGENAEVVSLYRIFVGSSPLTRGKRRPGQRSCVEVRLIPAHAGKTGALGVLGEVDRGSSPLTRGKPKRFRALQHSRRLIPAHAGKTVRGRCRRQSPRAHPRSRGENSDAGILSRPPTGSSPLTRGKLYPV